MAGVPSKALQLLNSTVKFNLRELPKPVWEPLTLHGMGMVKKRNYPYVSCAEICALKWCSWKQVPGSNVTFWTFPGSSPLCESVTWASNYKDLARSWEKHKPFKLMGEKQKNRSIKAFCCFKEHWCMWWWQRFEAYPQERSQQFNPPGFIQNTSSFGNWYKEGNLSSAPRCWYLSKCFILWSKLNLNHE